MDVSRGPRRHERRRGTMCSPPRMSRRASSIIPILAPAAPVVAHRGPAVVGALGAEAEAAHRRHALLVARVVAGLGAARPLAAGVDPTPGVVVGGLGVAGRWYEQGGGGDQGCGQQAHGTPPGVRSAVINTAA